jgi:hypothetical protein
VITSCSTLAAAPPVTRPLPARWWLPDARGAVQRPAATRTSGSLPAVRVASAIPPASGTPSVPTDLRERVSLIG